MSEHEATKLGHSEALLFARCLTWSELGLLYFLCFKFRPNFQRLHHFLFSLFLTRRRCFQFSLQLTASKLRHSAQQQAFKFSNIQFSIAVTVSSFKAVESVSCAVCRVACCPSDSMVFSVCLLIEVLWTSAAIETRFCKIQETLNDFVQPDLQPSEVFSVTVSLLVWWGLTKNWRASDFSSSATVRPTF